MFSKKTLIIIIPVYNEEGAIAQVLEKWVSELESMTFEHGWQIHVYNDGSKDRTAKILSDCANRNPDKIVVHNKTNSGHGPTILQGYRENAPKAEWLFQIDSDDEMGPEEFQHLWDLRENHDFLVGIRSGRKQGLPRRIISAFSRLTVRGLYGKSVWDVNSPYRLMRSDVFLEIYDLIPQNTFAPNVILSGMAAHKRLACTEIPVMQKNRQTGEVSLKKWKLFRAAGKSFFQTVQHGLKYGRGLGFFIGAAILSLILRLTISGLGWNYDFESYGIVAGLMEDGKCVYAETARYNYGPVWFYVLYGLKMMFGNSFRTGIILLLSGCDIGIAAILWKREYRFGALLFLLSPLTIYTSGYHNQFDNIAVLTAMLAVIVLADYNVSFKRVISGSILLGFSLMVKHIFIFYVFWLFFTYRSWRKKMLVLVIPLTIFSSGFLPYVLPEMARPDTGKQLQLLSRTVLKRNFKESRRYLDQEFFRNRPACRGIWNNIITYHSYDNRILHTWCLPRFIQKMIPADLLFFGGMILFGFLFRRKRLFSSLLYYTGILLILSVAITNQYLAIPGAFAAAAACPFGFGYHMLGLILLYGKNTYCGEVYLLAVCLLILIFIQIYRRQLKDFLLKISTILDDISPVD